MERNVSFLSNRKKMLGFSATYCVAINFTELIFLFFLVRINLDEWRTNLNDTIFSQDLVFF